MTVDALCSMEEDLGILDYMSVKAEGLRVPYTVLLEITRKCHLQCDHCYAAVSSERPELTLEELKTAIRQIREAGAFYILLTGGEVLVRPGFQELVACATEEHLAVKVLSTVSLLDEPMARFLAQMNVVEVSVSLYGSTPETHDRCTLVQGSWHRTMHGIELLRREGVKILLKFLLRRDNFGEYEGLKALATGLGCAFTTDANITARDNGDLYPRNLRPSEAQLEELFRDKIRLGAGRHFPKGGAKRTDFTCGAGHFLAAINAYGDILPCIQLSVPSGNVRTHRFKDVWEHGDVFETLRNGYSKKLTTCTQCSLNSLCSRCPGQALVEEGSLFGPSSAACRETKVWGRVLKAPGIPGIPLPAARR